MQTYDGEIRDGWEEYLVYGRLPLAVIVNGKKPQHIDENGYLIVGILNFLSAPGAYLNTNLALS